MSNLVFDEEWLKAYEQRTGRKVHDPKRPPVAIPQQKQEKKSKYRSAPTGSEGQRPEERLPVPQETGPRSCARNKFRAQPTMLDGKKYASKREAQRAAELKVLWQGHAIAGFAEQVEFLLPGGIRYRADFIVLNKDGTYTIEDTKGFQTKEYRMKKKLMAEAGHVIKEI